MVFDENSSLVKIWLKKVKEGLAIEEVPDLFNLREVIASLV